MVLVLKKEVVKTNNVEHEDTGKYRQLLVRTLHQCSVKFPDVASTIIPVVRCLSFLLDCSISVSVRVYGRGGFEPEDTECSTVIHQACTEFCSRHQRLNFYYKSAGLLFQTKHLLSVFEVHNNKDLSSLSTN